jgi:putative oxidoreductase
MRTRPILGLVGRLLTAPVFVSEGLRAAIDPAGRVGKAASWHVPAPELAVRANGVVMAAGGAALLVGGRVASAGAVAAAVCLVPTTVVGHPFWTEPTGPDRNAQRIHFLKNVAMLGGLLLAAAGARGTEPVGRPT